MIRAWWNRIENPWTKTGLIYLAAAIVLGLLLVLMGT